MDHNGAFTADEGIDVAQRKGNRAKAGENGMAIANGSVYTKNDSTTVEETEATPLLISTGNSDDDSDYAPPVGHTWTPGSEWEGLPWWKAPSPYWLLFPFILSALAFGGIIVPKINLILSLICREYFADKALKDGQPFSYIPSGFGEVEPQCRTPEVQERVSAFTLQGSLISGILAAIIAPKLGALSDRYGRKPIMCITNAGMLCGEIITIIAANYPATFPVKWLLLGYLFDGLCGSFIASMALSHSYATDCTPPNRRNVIFGYFHGCLFTGIALGPLLAGWLIKTVGSVIIMFYIALGCHVFFIIFLVFFIPESLTKSRQKAAREKHALKYELMSINGDTQSSIFKRLMSYNLFEPLKVLYPTGPGSSPAVRKNLLLLAAVDMIIFGVAMGAMSIVVIYSNYMFAWTTFEQSIFMSVINTSRVFVLLVILPGLTRIYRGKAGRRDSRPQPTSGTDIFELSILRVGIFFDFLGFLGYAMSRSSALFMASGAVASIGGMGSPTLQAALTKHVHPSQIGQLLGAMGLLHALARVVAPTIFNVIYIKTVRTFPQLVFVILTVLFGLAWGVSWFVKPGVTLEDPDEALRRRRESRLPDNTDADLAI